MCTVLHCFRDDSLNPFFSPGNCLKALWRLSTRNACERHFHIWILMSLRSWMLFWCCMFTSLFNVFTWHDVWFLVCSRTPKMSRAHSSTPDIKFGSWVSFFFFWEISAWSTMYDRVLSFFKKNSHYGVGEPLLRQGRQRLSKWRPGSLVPIPFWVIPHGILKWWEIDGLSIPRMSGAFQPCDLSYVISWQLIPHVSTCWACLLINTLSSTSRTNL